MDADVGALLVLPSRRCRVPGSLPFIPILVALLGRLLKLVTRGSG